MMTIMVIILSSTAIAEEMSWILLARSLRSLPQPTMSMVISSILTSPLPSRSSMLNISSLSASLPGPRTSRTSCLPVGRGKQSDLLVRLLLLLLLHAGPLKKAHLYMASCPTEQRDEKSLLANAFDALSVSRALDTIEWALEVLEMWRPVTSLAIVPIAYTTDHVHHGQQVDLR